MPRAILRRLAVLFFACLFASFCFPQLLPAQTTYQGTLLEHRVERRYRKASGCPIPNRRRPPRVKSDVVMKDVAVNLPGLVGNIGKLTITDIPSAFSCEIMRFTGGVAEVTMATEDVMVQLDDPTVLPDVVTLSDPPAVDTKISLEGTGKFTEGGDEHSVRIGVAIGLEEAITPIDKRKVRPDGCADDKDYTTEGESPRKLTSEAACGVSVLKVVPNSAKTSAVPQSRITEFEAEIISDFYIILDHGNAANGRGISNGASYSVTIFSRYKFQAEDSGDSIEIDLSSVEPENKDPLLAESIREDFKADVIYSLESREDGNVVIKLLHESQEVITPLIAPARKGTNQTVRFDLTAFTVPDAGELILRAELVSPDGEVLATSEDVLFEITDLDLKIDHIEIVQVIQNPSNTVALVAGKRAVARVFVKLVKGKAPPIADVLLEFYKGNAPPETRLVATQKIPMEPDRSRQNHSINYELPLSWTQRGEFRLVATVNPNKKVVEGDFTNNEFEVRQRFRPARNFSVRWVKVCYVLDKRYCPSEGGNNPQLSLLKLYPFADHNLLYEPLPVPEFDWRPMFPFVAGTMADKAHLVQRGLYRLYWKEIGRNRVPPFEQLLGWVPNKKVHGGLSNQRIFGNHTQIVAAEEDEQWNQDSVAHEIGHSLAARGRCSRFQAVRAGPKTQDCDWSRNGVLAGCGHSRSRSVRPAENGRLTVSKSQSKAFFASASPRGVPAPRSFLSTSDKLNAPP